MMNFCTLYDSNYISKGIALYLSIRRYTKDFTMYVMAMDRKCQQILNSLSLEGIIVECIEDIEDSKLEETKGNRSRAEFCWTCGSYSTYYFLQKYELPDITYLDSDLMFFCTPEVVFEELKKENVSIGIVSHFKKYNLFGKYNVEYVYFKNDDNGRTCLRWWRDECLKWCYNKLEDGKYGDQKYLEYFSEKFNNVYEIKNRGVGIASWNMNLYKYNNGNVFYKGQSWPIVFFHYNGFRINVENDILFFRHTIYLTNTIKDVFVKPYEELISEVFTKYLDIEINKVVVRPLEKIKYFVRTIIHYLDKFLPIEFILAQAMKIKYRQRKLAYSERKVSN